MFVTNGHSYLCLSLFNMLFEIVHMKKGMRRRRFVVQAISTIRIFEYSLN
jgi:hypothetical protein